LYEALLLRFLQITGIRSLNILQMVEKRMKDAKVGAALAIALVRANRFDDLEKLREL
jgi:hypothetical protein